MVARSINGKLESLSVNRVMHNGVLCDTQAAIEAAFLPINKAKVHASEDTDFLQPPLAPLFGPRGNPTVEDQVLQGTYEAPPSTPRYAKLFLSNCTTPPNLPPTDTKISTADHSAAWKKAKESSTRGKSKLTFAMYKAAITKKVGPLLAQFDASQRSMAYHTGYS